MYYVETNYYTRTNGHSYRSFSCKEDAIKEAAAIYYLTKEEVIIGNSNTGCVLICFKKLSKKSNIKKKYLGRRPWKD